MDSLRGWHDLLRQLSNHLHHLGAVVEDVELLNVSTSDSEQIHRVEDYRAPCLCLTLVVDLGRDVASIANEPPRYLVEPLRIELEYAGVKVSDRLAPADGL